MADPTDDEILAAARSALETALKTGKSVTFGGRTFQSQDLSELRDIIASFSLASGATTGSPRARFAAFNKGA